MNFQTMSFTANGLASRIISQMRTEARTPAHEGFKVHSKVTGFRGFLKLSVTVLGPNDVQQAHDLDAEYQKELAEEIVILVELRSKQILARCFSSLALVYQKMQRTLNLVGQKKSS